MWLCVLEDIRRWTTYTYTCKIPICPPFLVPPSVLPFSFSLSLSSHPPFSQFIFQFAPRSSQVCARRKFTEAARAPLEATLRRDKRVTISPSPPFLYLPLVLFSPFPLPVSAVTSLQGYTGPQGDLILAQVPQCRSLSSLSSAPAPPLLFSPAVSHPSFSSCLLLPSPARSLGARQWGHPVPSCPSARVFTCGVTARHIWSAYSWVFTLFSSLTHCWTTADLDGATSSPPSRYGAWCCCCGPSLTSINKIFSQQNQS